MSKRARRPRSQGPTRALAGDRVRRLSRSLRPSAAKEAKAPERRPPGIAGVPPASGPRAHRCRSGRDARAPRVRLGPWRRLQGPTPLPIATPVRRKGSESTGAASPWDRGRPARKWATGPQMSKRARRPRSQGPTRALAETPGFDASPDRYARPPQGKRKHRSGVPLGSRASRPQVGRRPTDVQAGGTPALPGFDSGPGGDSGVRRLSRLLRPFAAREAKAPERRPPGIAGVPPASGPQAHRCRSGRDARDPKDTSMRRVGAGVTSDDAAPIPQPVEGRGIGVAPGDDGSAAPA